MTKRKKDVIVGVLLVIVISGVLGVLREVFLKAYEEKYHFWISVLFGCIVGFFAGLWIRKFWTREDD